MVLFRLFRYLKMKTRIDMSQTGFDEKKDKIKNENEIVSISFFEKQMKYFDLCCAKCNFAEDEPVRIYSRWFQSGDYSRHFMA